MKNEILKLLENDARLTDKQLAVMMNTDERDAELPDVRAELAALATTMSEVKTLVEKIKRRLSDIYDGVDIL